jgi:hypothetical protein
VRSRTVVWIGAVASTLFILPPRLLLAQATTVTCPSKEGQRQDCPADTSAVVALQRSFGSAECLLGKTWGYSGDLIWVSDGCSGEFLLGQLATSSKPGPAPQAQQPIETWGAVESGKGFLVGRTEVGELNISAYALTRYLNQLPAHQTFKIFGDKKAGFRNSNEYLGGLNFYLAHSRNHRLNFQAIHVNRSPVNSSFGYYVGGQRGTTIAAALSIFF